MPSILFNALNACSIQQNESENPLTFTAVEDGSNISLIYEGSVNTQGIQYRLGESGAWTSYDIQNGQTITLNTRRIYSIPKSYRNNLV